MSDIDSHSDKRLDQWFADQHHHLVTDTTAALDVEAGLREALIPARHRDIVADLGSSLDVEAGLAAIVPSTPDETSSTEPSTSDAPTADTALVTGTSPSEAAAGQTELDALLRGLIQAAPSWSPSTRLAIRACLQFTPEALATARALERDLALVRDLDIDLDLARALDRALDGVRVRALHLDRALARTMQALVDLRDVLSDVTGVDLRGVDLAGIPLEGVRWSAETRWPPQWEDQIRRDSEEIADGVFEVRPGGTTYASTSV